MKIDPTLKKKLKTAVIAKLREQEKETVIVETPHALTDAQRELLLEQFPMFKDKTVINTIKPSLIGGFVIKHSSKVIDASLKSKLESIVSELHVH